jgi:hypothetical protein
MEDLVLRPNHATIPAEDDRENMNRKRDEPLALNRVAADQPAATLDALRSPRPPPVLNAPRNQGGIGPGAENPTKSRKVAQNPR